ncbi:MAG TPA: hypothetical protein DGG94_09335 [Micromonosporaceae bacterium]|nr:hypothetical protein [Micromonosporaceae bacterium]
MPCPQQPERWNPADQREWRRLLDLADPEVSKTFADHYSPSVMHERNDGMLRDSHAVLCVWQPSRRSGGTWSAVCSAHKLSKPGLHLDPIARTVRFGLPALTITT